MTLWENIQDFSYHYFDPFEEGPELKPFETLISVWRSKCQAGRIPAWSDFDFTDFVGWHGKIAIYDISYDPFDYKIRLSGEQYNQILARNVKGMTREALTAIAVVGNKSAKFYEKTATEMLFSYTNGINVVDRQHIEVEFLELPLSDNGLHATHSIEAFNIRGSNTHGE